jgi:hypothetical protein
MSILNMHPTTERGGRPRTLGSLVWDKRDHRYGIFVGYDNGDNQICLSLKDFEKLMNARDSSYHIDMVIKRRGRVWGLLRRVHKFFIDRWGD